MVKILNCYLYAKKSYGLLSKGAIFISHPCTLLPDLLALVLLRVVVHYSVDVKLFLRVLAQST